MLTTNAASAFALLLCLKKKSHPARLILPNTWCSKARLEKRIAARSPLDPQRP
jgi:hypothetical protein